MRGQLEYIHTFSGSRRAADLREAVPRRRVQRPRLRHPHDRADRSADRPRARRQQEPAVQRRADHQHRRPGAADPLLRRRPGARHRRAVRWTRTCMVRSQPSPLPLLSDPFATRLRLQRSERLRRFRRRSSSADQRVQDVDGRRGPLLHAGAERAVPADLRLEPDRGGRAEQQPAAAEGVPVPVRGRHDVLTRATDCPARPALI